MLPINTYPLGPPPKHRMWCLFPGSTQFQAGAGREFHRLKKKTQNVVGGGLEGG